MPPEWTTGAWLLVEENQLRKMQCARTCRRLASEGSWCITARWSGWWLCTDPRCCCVGWYSGETGMITCQPCPLNFGSPIGSTSVSNCTCAPGFFGPAEGPCTPCPSGTYKKDTGTAAACTPCPAGQWSVTQSVDAAVYLTPRRACLQLQICNITSYHITCINRLKKQKK